MDNDAPPPGHKLNDLHWFTLRAIADVIVPPNAGLNVPGAGDEAICKGVLHDVGKRLPRLVAILDALHLRAVEAGGENYYMLSDAQRERVGLAFRNTDARLADRLASWVVQSYYRDDRVLASLGIEARPPFPQGYELAEGDWSKLERVRSRAPFYRKPG